MDLCRFAVQQGLKLRSWRRRCTNLNGTQFWKGAKSLCISSWELRSSNSSKKKHLRKSFAPGWVPSLAKKILHILFLKKGAPQWTDWEAPPNGIGGRFNWERVKMSLVFAIFRVIIVFNFPTRRCSFASAHVWEAVAQYFAVKLFIKFFWKARLVWIGASRGLDGTNRGTPKTIDD